MPPSGEMMLLNKLEADHRTLCKNLYLCRIKEMTRFTDLDVVTQIVITLLFSFLLLLNFSGKAMLFFFGFSSRQTNILVLFIIPSILNKTCFQMKNNNNPHHNVATTMFNCGYCVLSVVLESNILFKVVA